MPDISQTLEQAYDLINRGDLLAAQQLLQPHIDENSSNPDIWWLYAHATENSSAGRNALMKVVSLEPTYPGATDLINQYDDLQSDDDFVYTPPKSKKPKQESNRRSRLLPLLIVLILIVGVIAAVLLLDGRNNNPVDQVAQQSTEQPPLTQTNIVPTVDAQTAGQVTDDVTPAPTEILMIPTETVVRDPVTLIRVRLANRPLITGSSVTIEETLVGNTIRVAVCTPSTTNERQTLLNEMMEDLGNQLDIIPENVDAIAIALINCEDGTLIRTIAAPIESVIAYVANESLFRDFQAQWVPIE